MSVVASKRRPSKLRIITESNKFRRELQDAMYYNFGYKPDIIKKDIETETQFQSRLETEKLILNSAKTYLIEQCREVVANVVTANNIQIFTPEDLVKRRNYQNDAIYNLYRIITEIQYIIHALNINPKKFFRFDSSIQGLIQGIKAWRKSDNRFKKKFNKTNIGDKVSDTKALQLESDD